MAGRWVWMSGHRIYLPPFANQRFTAPRFWACTFTSMINGAQVGFLGKIDRDRRRAGQSIAHVVKALAHESPDPELLDGSSTADMVAAMAARYGRTVTATGVSPDLGRRRLIHGKVLVAGVTYGELPKKHRRWSPNFKDGHRVICVGWRDGANDPNDGDTRILDPLVPRGLDYAGEWIPWSAVTAAYWSGEQVWVEPGGFLPRATVTVEREFSPARTFRIARGATIRAFMPQAAGIAKERTFDAARTGRFDALVRIGQPPDAESDRPKGQFLRVIEGPFAGMFLRPGNPGLSAATDPAAGAPRAALPSGILGPDDDDLAGDDVNVGDLPPAEAGEPRRTAVPDSLSDDDPDPPSGDLDDADDAI